MTFTEFVKAHWLALAKSIKRSPIPVPCAHLQHLETIVDAVSRGERVVCTWPRSIPRRRNADTLTWLRELAQTERDPERLAAIERVCEKLEGLIS